MSDLPEALLNLLKLSIPSFAAAELLLSLANEPERLWEPVEMAAVRQPPTSLDLIVEYLSLFQSTGLIAEQDGRFRYQPRSQEIGASVKMLALAYNERPVTLIKTIYAFEDRKIQSFADAFKLKGE